MLPPVEYGWDPFGAYGISKLANVLHAREASKRWKSDGVRAFAAHPGIVPTSLGQVRASSFGATLHNAGVWIWWHVVAKPVAEPVQSGAASVVYAALSPTLDTRNGEYIRHCQIAQPSDAALNASAAAWLWAESKRLLREVRKGAPSDLASLGSSCSAEPA